jgi:hypothetical protein
MRYLVFGGRDVQRTVHLLRKKKRQSRFKQWKLAFRQIQRGEHLLAVLGFAASSWRLASRDRYNYQPVLLETFVQLDRFKGTCYQAANWIEVGETEGYSLFSSYKRHAIAKAIYIYPLRKNFRRQLCRL